MQIPIFYDSRLVDLCDSARVKRYLEAPNAEVVRARKTRQIVRINVSSVDDGRLERSSLGNPQKYTFLEALTGPYPCDCGGHDRKCIFCGGTGVIQQFDSRCHSLKPHIATPRNWPLFRAALIDCLPADKQAALRELFKPIRPKKKRQAAS